MYLFVYLYLFLQIRLVPPLPVYYQKVHSSLLSIFASFFLNSEKSAIFLNIFTYWINPPVCNQSPITTAVPYFAELPSPYLC